MCTKDARFLLTRKYPCAKIGVKKEGVTISRPREKYMQFICATDKYCSLKEHVPAPIFRRTFDVFGEVKRATLDITVTGFYQLYVNGVDITKGLLAPYISNPDHVLYLDSYDIAPYLSEGKNAIAVILGNGFANQDVTSWEFNVAPFRTAPKLAMRVEVDAEGGDVRFCADESFKTSPSPILFDMYRYGVIYDARKEQEGFALPDFDDSEWTNAVFCDAPHGVITPSRALPIRIREERKAVKIERQSDFYCLYYKDGRPMPECYIPDGYLYDFGINAAGVCRLKIKGERGQKISIRHGENLRDSFFDIGSTVTIKNDTPETINYLQRDVYYLKGGEEEIFLPSFTYHGFRYAFVEGITEEQATDELLTYAVFSTDVKKRSHFECSDEVLNTLYDMTLRTDLSNFHHFPTDCPHREKNGWTGDASVSAHQLLLAFDCAESLGVWLESARYSQTAEGKLPGIIPTATWGYAWGSGPAWDAVIFNVPYYAYRYDGRVDLIRENADMMYKYLRYVASHRDERGLVALGLGDWCQPRENGEPIAAPLELTDSVQVIEMAEKGAVMFGAVGRTEARAYAESLAREMRRAVRIHLIDTEKRIAAGNCQTSQAIAIRFGLFTEQERPDAYSNLIAMIKAKDGHVSCGMIGLRHIFHVLFAGGDVDLALNMITREDAPSYGSMIKLGGTSLFESLIPNGLNESENHHFYGDILHLFIAKLVGIRVNPTLKNTSCAVISPTVPKSISYAFASYDFKEGTLSARWEKTDDGRVEITVNVPYGVEATISYGDYTSTLEKGENKLVCSM